MKTILVATDFSPAALNAGQYAVNMAMAINAELFLLHIYTIPVGYNDVPVLLNPVEWRKDAEEDMQSYISELKTKTGSQIHIQAEVVMGTFFQELKSACEKIHPYIVVLGSQGTTAAERVIFGGHSVQAMKNLEWPLITVPRNVHFKTIRNICFAFDFEEVAEAFPVEEVKMLVTDFRAKLHILNTGKKGSFEPKIVSGTAILKNMLGTLQPEFHFITSEHADDGIMEFSKKNEIDLLIILPRRHSLLEKIIHRSHTRQLVLHSHVPVMALHR